MSTPTYRAGKADRAAMGLDSREDPSWAFVSNLSIEDSGGGFSGMNLAAWSVLSARFDSRYVGPVCPSTDRLAALLSKGSKLARLPRSFFAFSERRLAQFKEQVIGELSTDPPHMVMFHGFTPWIKVDPGVPYVAWSDCTFKEYMRTYHDERTFRSRDLDRIHRQEAQWLRGATRVIFSSQYAARIAQSECGLDTNRVGVVGTCGQIELPDRDRYSGSMDFLFVSTNFDKKGGAVAAAAVQRLRREGLEVSLSVVGDRPPAQIEEMRGVTYRGWLKKSDPVQRQEFIDLLSGSRALIHPTLADMNPLILFEAAYHGCPAVSSRRFAIPEFLEDGRNGFLLEEPRSTEELAAAMSQLAQMSPPDYAAMRLEAWRRSRQRATPEAFNARLLHEIQIGASHAF